MIRVLFVCLGNICRSPMAEAVFRKRVEEAGLEGSIYINSAGTGHWHIGKPPHRGTLAVLSSNGISTAHRARQLDQSDLDNFEYIIVMDEMNLADVQLLGNGRSEVTRLLDYAPEIGKGDVPDPYMTGAFEEVYELVSAGTERLLEHIKTRHNL